MEGRFSCFPFGAITNEAAMNSLVKKNTQHYKVGGTLVSFCILRFSLNLIFLSVIPVDLIELGLL